MTRRSVFSSLLACAALGLLSPSALAQDALASALKTQGDAALVGGRFTEALDAYTRAASIEDNPALHYNRARALQALDRNAEAVDELEDFERQASPELLARVPQLDRLLTQVRSRVATLRVSDALPPGTRAHWGARELDLRALASGMHVDAGFAVLLLERDGFLPIRKSLQLAPASVVSVPLRWVRRDESALLRVRSPVASARVFVDGDLVSQVPAELRLAPSAHTVRVERAGYESSTVRVVLIPQETRAIDVSLSRDRPLTSSPWFWAGVGAAAVATTVVIVALSTERGPGSGDIAPGTVSAPLFRFR